MSNQKNNLSWFRFLRPTLTALTEDLRSQTISTTDIVIYLVMRSAAALSERGYKHGQVELSISELIDLTGFSRSTIKRSLANLGRQDYLNKFSHQGQSGVYVARDVAPLKGAELASWDYVPRDETQLIKNMADYARGDTSEPPPGVTIEQLQINIQVNNHFYGTDEPRGRNERDLQSMIDMIENPRTPPAIRQKLVESYTQLTSDPGHW